MAHDAGRHPHDGPVDDTGARCNALALQRGTVAHQNESRGIIHGRGIARRDLAPRAEGRTQAGQFFRRGTGAHAFIGIEDPHGTLARLGVGHINAHDLPRQKARGLRHKGAALAHRAPVVHCGAGQPEILCQVFGCLAHVFLAERAAIGPVQHVLHHGRPPLDPAAQGGDGVRHTGIAFGTARDRQTRMAAVHLLRCRQDRLQTRGAGPHHRQRPGGFRQPGLDPDDARAEQAVAPRWHGGRQHDVIQVGAVDACPRDTAGGHSRRQVGHLDPAEGPVEGPQRTPDAASDDCLCHGVPILCCCGTLSARTMRVSAIPPA